MPNSSEQLDKINETVSNINEVTQGDNSPIADTPTLTPISSETLQDTGSVNFPTEQPTPDINTAEAQITAQGDSLVESITAQTDAKVNQAEAAKEASMNDLNKFISGQQGFEGYYAQEFQDRGIEDIQGNIAQLKGTIRSEQAARAEMKQRIETQGGGLKMGANAEYSNFARDSLFKETNAVIQMGVYSDNLSAAENAATTIANAYYRQEQNELQRRQNLVNDNKDLFDKYELRQFNIDYANAQRELDNQAEQMKTLQTTKLDMLKSLKLEGAPDDIISAVGSATTPEDVISAAGDWLGKSDREYKRLRNAVEAQKYQDMITKLTNPEGLDAETREKIGKFAPTQTAISQIRVAQGMNKLKGLIKEYGTLNPADREASSQIAALRSSLMLDIATANGQGAISDGDRGQYEEILGKGWAAGTAIKGLETSLGQVNAKIESNIGLVESTYPDAVGFEPFKEHLGQIKLNQYLDEQLGGQQQTDEQAIKDYITGTINQL